MILVFNLVKTLWKEAYRSKEPWKLEPLIPRNEEKKENNEKTERYGKPAGFGECWHWMLKFPVALIFSP